MNSEILKTLLSDQKKHDRNQCFSMVLMKIFRSIVWIAKLIYRSIPNESKICQNRDAEFLNFSLCLLFWVHNKISREDVHRQELNLMLCWTFYQAVCAGKHYLKDGSLFNMGLLGLYFLTTRHWTAPFSSNFVLEKVGFFSMNFDRFL